MLPFLKIKRCWECQNFSFRRKGKQEGTCHLKKACEGWGTNERAEDKTWNVISARNARQLVLLRNDAAPLKGGNKRRWRCGFSGRPPRKCTRWLHEHYLVNLHSVNLFFFEKRTRSVWMQHLKISTLGLDFGTLCGLCDTTTWGPTVGNTCLQTLLLVFFFFFWVCVWAAGRHTSAPLVVQCELSGQQSMNYGFSGGTDAFQICSFDLVTESYSIFFRTALTTLCCRCSGRGQQGRRGESSFCTSARSSLPKL